MLLLLLLLKLRLRLRLTLLGLRLLLLERDTDLLRFPTGRRGGLRDLERYLRGGESRRYVAGLRGEAARRGERRLGEGRLGEGGLSIMTLIVAPSTCPWFM